MSAHEKANAQAGQGSSIAKGAAMGEEAHAEGRYVFECFDRDGNLKWRDTIDNLVVTEGKNAALTHFLKGSSYTASQVLGLIESTGYSAIGAGNTAAGITAAGGGSPTNGWNEAPSSVAATRGTPAFGTASAGALATSSAVAFSILAARTIKGAFLLCRTSNPGGDDFQPQRLLDLPGQPRLYEHIAALAQGPWNLNGQLGLVVGATYPAEIERVRALAPTLPLLIPGVGAQGGDAVATVKAGWRGAGGQTTGPIVVNSSRAILYASSGTDFAAAARQEAVKTRDLLQAAVLPV